MRHNKTIASQFYLTSPMPCPYLPDRMERKLFTSLNAGNAQAMHNSLALQGFRRSQNILYRPACKNCIACFPVRINAEDFIPSKTQKRTLKRNKFLTRKIRSPWATEEQYHLFKSYLQARHSDGDMTEMEMHDFASMIEETSVFTRVVEYRDAESNKLAAACLTDFIEDGVSLVYSFFRPDLPKQSLGSHIILDHVQLAREVALKCVYLGYWVPGTQKMGYKSSFTGLEIFHKGEWSVLADEEQYYPQNHKSACASISCRLSNMVDLPK